MGTGGEGRVRYGAALQTNGPGCLALRCEKNIYINSFTPKSDVKFPLLTRNMTSHSMVNLALAT